jgi:cation:H+ antiporter
MVTHFLVLALALVILLLGGEALVRGASALARRFVVSPMVIGLTVVAFGTSAPELAVSISAALDGNSAIAFGNVVGSNIGNVALILGLTALVKPLAVNSTIVSREIPMMILACVAMTVFALDRSLDGAVGNVLSRGDGLGLLLFFAVFLYYTAGGQLLGAGADPLIEAPPRPPSSQGFARTRAVALTLAGLGALVLGGHLMVDAATAIARALGVAELVIGLTIVAIGTSLPELVTSLLAAIRGEPDIAIGNIVGSNIFNALFVLGSSAVVRPIEVEAGSALDLLVMCVLAVVLLPMAVTHRRRITRMEGAILLAAYAAYLTWQVNR